MKELYKTIALVVVAALIGFISLSNSGSDSEDVFFSDLGQEFYPDFIDPLAVASLEVYEYNEDLAAITPFKVLLKDGQWTIPSHSDYPVDAKDKMEKLATSFIGVKKDEIRSDKPADHKELQLIDPNDTKVQALAGRGTRVTLKDAQGRVLADYILGKSLEGKADYQFIRQPGNNKSYAAKIDVDLSSNFADWINTALLDFSANEAKKVTLADYKVDQGRLVSGESYQLDKKESEWTTADLPEEKELDQSKINSIISTLGSLKIIGVRPKPEALAATLEVDKQLKMGEAEVASLAAKGFYVTQEGQLVSNEGETAFTLDSGVSYTIRYGNSFMGIGTEVSSGEVSEGQSKDSDKSGSLSRYLFIMAQLDQDFLGQAPEQLKEPDELGETEDEAAKKAHEEAVSAYKKAQKLFDEWEEKRKSAEEKVSELNKRFAQWYYVIDGASYDKIRVPFADILKDKEKVKEEVEPETAPKTEGN